MDSTAFEAERARLTSVAARILGSHAEADDVLQEAWLRFSRSVGVDDPPAWLTTVVTRLCLDHLRRQRVRSRTEAAAEAGPVARVPVDPEGDALFAERVGEAMQVVLDTLTPTERAAFVLHDLFDYPFDEISSALGRSGPAVRQLASRARRKVQGAPEPAAERVARAESRRVVEAFLLAARGGELTTALSLLAPGVVLRADLAAQEMGTPAQYDGADAVAGRFDGARGAVPVEIDGDLGAAWILRGELKVAFVFHVEAGLVRDIELIADPEILATLDVTRRGQPTSTR